MRGTAVALRVALIASLLLAACGSAATPTASPAPTGAPAATPSAPAVQPTATVPAADVTPSASPYVPTAPPVDPIATVIAWVVGLGPGSPEGPDQVDAYKLILSATADGCRQGVQFEFDLPEAATLYHGAAAACLAALHGKEHRWAEAQAAYDALGGPPEGCVDRQTYDMLELVVTAYRANPQTQFEIQPELNTVQLRCPRISDVSVTRAGRGYVDIAIHGERLGRVVQITYALVDACPQPPDMQGTHFADPATQARDSLTANVQVVSGSSAPGYLWVGITAAPHPWVADSRCVAIE